HGEEDDGERGSACRAIDRHAAILLCWLGTAAIFRQPSILRNSICPLAEQDKPCVLTRQRDSSSSLVHEAERPRRALRRDRQARDARARRVLGGVGDGGGGRADRRLADAARIERAESFA